MKKKNIEPKMTKEEFKMLLDCVIDAAELAESYNHGRRYHETVFCNLVAAKIAFEKFGLTLTKIAEYLDNKPKRSALTLGYRNMNAHIRLFGDYYHMSADKAYNVKELINKVIYTYYIRMGNYYFSFFKQKYENIDIMLGLQRNFKIEPMRPAIVVDKKQYYHIAINKDGKWYSLTKHAIIDCKIIKLKYL
jgi:hypothetical protein